MIFEKETCISCGACETACPFAALSMKDGMPDLAEDCKNCGACARVCPVGALREEKAALSPMGSAAGSGYWVVGLEEGTQQGLSKVTLELISAARRLAEKKPADVTLVVSGKALPNRWIRDAAQVGCDEILHVVGEPDCGIMTFWTDAIEAVVRSRMPEVLLLPAVADGRDLAPKLACRLQTGLTADCTSLEMGEDGNLLQIRPTYGGNILATIVTPMHRPQMASIRPNVMRILPLAQPSSVRVTAVDAVPKGNHSNGIHLLKRQPKNDSFQSLDEAQIILAGGYGMGSAENFQLLFRLAARLNAAIGASRKAVDAGWVPAAIQIGQTGKSVSPEVYVGFGLSGALQHTMGMNQSKRVIAINSDPAAPIFKMCDVPILGDAAAIVRCMLEKLDNGKTPIELIQSLNGEAPARV